MADNIQIDVQTTVQNIDVNVTPVSTPSISIDYSYPQGPAGPSIWGVITGTLSSQTDLWRYLSAETFSPSQLTAFLNSNAISLCSLNVNGTILSAGVNLFDIFLTTETDSQTLSYTPSSYLLSISNGNTVNLSSINSTFATNSGKYESVFTTVQNTSTDWNNAYNTGTVYQANSAFYATESYVNGNFLALSGGLVSGPVRINNNLTVFGNISSTGIVYAQSVGPIGLSAVQQTFVTLTLNEVSELLTVNNPVSSIIIIPTDSTTNFVNGSQVNISRIGAGTVTVSASPGVFLRSADNKKELRVQNSTATVVKLSANDWLLFGDIV